MENGDVVLWLGEAKFHQQFSGAVIDAIKSISEHCKINYLKDEISILASNIELNETFQDYEKINDVLNGGVTLDKVKIRIPVLITYDCNVVPKHTDIEDALFIDEMGKEFIAKFKNIDSHGLELSKNIEVMFIVVPLESVGNIKTEIEKLEEAMR